MNIWYANKRTGKFPLPRILWNIIFIIPLELLRLLFVFFVMIQSGPKRAKEAWKATN